MEKPSLADRIRQFALENYIKPAKERGLSVVAIKAGDVHRDMGLSNCMPNVCSALGSNKFNELAEAVTVSRTGPANGSNVVMTFDLTSVSRSSARVPRSKRSGPAATRSDTHRHVEPFDLRDALVLVSCVKSKLPHRAPARSLYTSAWFTKARDLVEACGADWMVLSTQYGLVPPDTEIKPYDYTLNRLGVAERRAWASQVLEQLHPLLKGRSKIVMFAGERYREFLIGPLEESGIKVEVPMANLRRGEQLAWLSEQV